MFKKEFSYNENKGFYVKNISEVENYIKDKCSFFVQYKNFTNKNEILKLYQETLDMIAYDMTTATFDFSAISSIGFNGNSEAEQVVYFYNAVFILGSVYYNTLFVKGNRLIDVLDGENGPISTNDMFSKSYINFYNHYINNIQGFSQECLYGDTLVFATLVEVEFKKTVKQLYFVDKLKEIDNLVSADKNFSNDDEDLIEYLKNGSEKCKFKYDAVAAKTDLCFSFFERIGILSDGRNEKAFIMNELTLNQFCNSTVTKKYVSPIFLKIMDTLFSPQKCNLRNDLAHCNFGYRNYYHISATSILLGLLEAISNEIHVI